MTGFTPTHSIDVLTPFEWCNVAPETPDDVLDFIDISWVVAAFQGGDYPFEPPCP